MREAPGGVSAKEVIDSLRDDIALLKLRDRIVTERQTELTGKILNLRSENGKLVQQVTNLEAQLEGAQNDLRVAQDNLRVAQDNAANELVSMQAQPTEELKQKISELERQLADNQNRSCIAALEANELARRITLRANAQVIHLDLAIKELTNRPKSTDTVELSAAENNLLRQRITDANAEIVRLTAQLNRQAEENKTLKAAAPSVAFPAKTVTKNAHQILQDRYDKLEIQFKSLEENLASAVQKITRISAERDQAIEAARKRAEGAQKALVYTKFMANIPGSGPFYPSLSAIEAALSGKLCATGGQEFFPLPHPQQPSPAVSTPGFHNTKKK